MAVVMATIAIHPTFGQSTYKLQPGQNWSVSYLLLPFFVFCATIRKYSSTHLCSQILFPNPSHTHYLRPSGKKEVDIDGLAPAKNYVSVGSAP